MPTKFSYLPNVDQSIARILNRQAVLQQIRAKELVTPRQLSRLTGLSAPTILSVLDDLVQDRIVTQEDFNPSNLALKGRPPRHFRFSSKRSCAIGVDVGPDGLVVILADLHAQAVVRVEHVWQGAADHEGYIHQIVESIGEVQRAAVTTGHEWATRIDAIGIALRGLVNAGSGTPLNYAPLHKLDGIPVGQMVADRTGCTVVVDNNVLVMAWGEYWFGAGRGIDNLLCINVGRGVGGSAIVNGQLLRGPDGSMLEIGHTTVDTEGPRCWCGNYGCLELYASDTSVVKRVIKSIKLGHTTVLADMTSSELQTLTIDTICAAARLGDPLALQAIHEAALYMAVGMTNLINLLNPEAIIVTGWVHDVEEILLTEIQEIIAKRALAPLAQRVRLIPAHFRQDTMAQGAIALALCAAGIVPSNTTMWHADTSHAPWPILIKPQNPIR